MAQLTLLEMTQDILSAMTSDEINSISDSTEAMQIATIIKTKYYDIVSRGDLPEHNQLFQLDPSNDATSPTLMYIPDGISKLQWLKYFDSNINDGSAVDQYGAYSHDLNTDISNTPIWTTTSTTSITMAVQLFTFTVASSTLGVTLGQGVTCTSGSNIMYGTLTSYSGTTMVINVYAITGAGTYSSWVIAQNNDGISSAPGYQYVTVVPIQQFLDIVNLFDPTENDVQTYTFRDTSNSYPSSYTFYYKNDHQPQYCTVLSNFYVLFDSYDNTQDVTLQSSKTMCFGQVVPQFQMVDSFIPDLNDQQFPLLMSEAKALAWFELKQAVHAKAEQELKRQWSTVQKNKAISNKPSYFDQLPNFGRVPGTGGYGGYRTGRWNQGNS